MNFPKGKREFAWKAITLLSLMTLFAFALSGCQEKNEFTKAATDKLRIISTMPSLTEICFALGLQENLVGVSDFCNYPPEVKEIPRIGGIINPNFERVMAIRPDLVLLQKTDDRLIEKYKKLGLKTLVLEKDTIQHVYDSIITIGNETGKEDKAEQLVKKMKAEFEEIRAKTARQKPVKTLLVIGHEPGSLREIYTAAKGSFHNELLEIAGGENCLPDSSIPYPKISKEEIMKQSPQAIIVLSANYGMAKGDQTEESHLWEKLDYIDAVKNGAVRVLNGNYLFIPGPRMPLIAKDMQSALQKGQKADK